LNFVTSIPDKDEMAKALRDCGELLLKCNILSSDGFSAVVATAERLRGKAAFSWDYAIPKAEPMTFSSCVDRLGRRFTPKIGVEGINVVRPSNDAVLPFRRWDIALTLEFDDADVHCPRWHFDMANVEQPGPITHLQYGGYRHAGRSDLDTVIKEPRWFTAPLDVILLSEVVAANFFPEIWLQTLREDRRWCSLVHLSQNFCYPPFLSAMVASLGVSGASPILGLSWNDRWSERRP
jgi:hypothetical protein